MRVMREQGLIKSLISSAENAVVNWLEKTRNLGVSGHVGELKIMRYAMHGFFYNSRCSS